jgi:hypothetical protein
VISIAVVASIFAVSLKHAEAFAPYFGDLPPVIAAMLVCSAGIAAFYMLHEHSNFYVIVPQTAKRGILAAAILSIPFMISVTLADVVLRFPVDINVPLPTALAFYPAMGYIAQIALHIVPFALLLLFGEFFLGSWTVRRRVWLSIALVAAIEASFQVGTSVTQGGLSSLSTFVIAQLYLFGVAELYLFSRFDFASMYVFRLTYYCYWHIVWGDLRLQWLF